MYKVGSIVTLEDLKRNKGHIQFIRLARDIKKKGFEYLIILKEIEDNYSLIARCLKSRKPGDWYYTIKIDNKKYHVAVKKFIKVPNVILIHQNINVSSKNTDELIKNIFHEHDNYHNKRNLSDKKKREIELSKKYFSIYQNATINNDLITLKELEEILGKNPTVFFAGNLTAREKSAKLNSDNAARPYHGGTFSPK